MRRAQESLRRDLGREPKLREVAQELNISEDLALAALESMRAPSSLEEQVHQDEGQPVYLVDRIKQPDTGEEGRVLQLALRQLLSSLPRRDQHILAARYFQLKTQAEVASELGISQVQVSRLEKAILLRLRQLLL
ncbi:MAG: RNA polymerase sigma-F factor [Firmicutes bacterium]|nr:RNA polymerase sigma-F factor [Bacillota bacterium]